MKGKPPNESREPINMAQQVPGPDRRGDPSAQRKYVRRTDGRYRVDDLYPMDEVRGGPEAAELGNLGNGDAQGGQAPGLPAGEPSTVAWERSGVLITKEDAQFFEINHSKRLGWRPLRGWQAEIAIRDQEIARLKRHLNDVCAELDSLSKAIRKLTKDRS